MSSPGADLNQAQGPEFVRSTLLRDQDVTLDFEAFADVFSRALPFLRGTQHDFAAKLASDPQYFALQTY
jgi:hypothetical protein